MTVHLFERRLGWQYSGMANAETLPAQAPARLPKESIQA
jgi:hypothetical protein